MKERPILFNGEMVRATLSGQKTQTRRALSPQPVTVQQGLIGPLNGSGNLLVCKHGQPGDRLWVRETHAIVPRTAYAMSDGVDQVFRPGNDHDAAIFKAGWKLSPPGRWRPSIHMPRWASRITLEITGVRIERLQDITEEDARAEGINCYPFIPDDGYPVCNGYTHLDDDGKCTLWPTAKRAFENLWESINGLGSWEKNPWVWVLEFKREES
ncbi:hypothetical protein [Spongiibacter sp. UBA1325]|uniref:hypothetical protein n=1 Tax=Spongiibacter sp. UBA1325 TaxID=1947543 RepID=UPI00257FFE8D|nr:hypothetical protein [Spongiibacter sp. UBA1325]|tara:strand:- start:20419 stop:21054 length:636 start_codon:yes stop_codon:yes gene_type:complete